MVANLSFTAHYAAFHDPPFALCFSFVKYRLDHPRRTPRRIAPTVQVLPMRHVYKIIHAALDPLGAIGVDQHQLDLHPLGDNAFDVYRRTVSHRQVDLGAVLLADLGQSRQIGRQLNENAVVLDAADDPRHRLPRRELGGVFLPCAEHNAAVTLADIARSAAWTDRYLTE